MLDHLRKTSLVVIVCVFAALPVFSSSPGTSIFPFLKIPVSARAAASGGNKSIICGQSSVLNPAITSLMNCHEITFEHIAYLQQSNYNIVSYAGPIGRKSGLGLSIGYLGLDGFKRTVADTSLEGYAEQGSFGFSDIFMSAGFSRKISHGYSVGGAIKMAQESIDSNSISGVMGSASIVYKAPWLPWQISGGINNIGSQVKGYDLPSSLYLDFWKKHREKISFGGGGSLYNDNSGELYAGAEYKINQTFNFRAGYKYSLKDNKQGDLPYVDLSAGFGAVFKNCNLDYAWLPYGDLGMTHHFSISTRFGSRADEMEVPPEQQNDELGTAQTQKQSQSQKTDSIRTDSKKHDRMAITNFNPGNVTEMDAWSVSDFIRSDLAKKSRFNIIDRSTMDSILAEQNMARAGVSSRDKAVRAGEILNVDLIIYGCLTVNQDQFIISASLVEVRTGQVIKTSERSTENIFEVRNKCREIAEELMEN